MCAHTGRTCKTPHIPYAVPIKIFIQGSIAPDYTLGPPFIPGLFRDPQTPVGGGWGRVGLPHPRLVGGWLQHVTIGVLCPWPHPSLNSCNHGPHPSQEGASITISLRQALDLYCNVRPIWYLQGVPSPLKRPELVNVTVFRCV